MEATPENLQALSNFLKQTMSPDSKARNQAEDFLRQHEGQRGFALLLLNLLGSDSNDPEMQTVKLAAAINFKNFIKRNWKIVSLPLFSLFCLYLEAFFFKENKKGKFLRTYLVVIETFIVFFDL